LAAKLIENYPREVLTLGIDKVISNAKNAKKS
jgi:hypothetical protein